MKYYSHLRFFVYIYIYIYIYIVCFFDNIKVSCLYSFGPGYFTEELCNLSNVCFFSILC